MSFFSKSRGCQWNTFLHNGGKNSTIFKPTPRYITRVGIPQCSHARQPSAVCKRNSSSDRQKVKGEREVSMGTTGLGEREAVVVWISAHVTNNLLLRLPSRGLTICMAGRHADSESKQTQHLGAPLRLSPCLSKATHLLPSCGARERDKEREREIFRSYFKHCQVTLFLHYMRASASRTLGGLFGDV